jgi:ABC-type transport system involved in multi-copper enzyme maturation permease subunit
MFKKLLIKEIQLNLISRRFQVAFVIVVTVFITGSVLNIKELHEKREIYNKYYTQWINDIRQQAKSNVSDLATHTKTFLFGPRENSFISDCKERFIPNSIVYNAFNVYEFNLRQSVNNPLLNRFEEINWSFIMIFVISLLALMLTFDSISGEREALTLSLCLTNPVSRAQILLAKLTSCILLLTTTLIVGILLSLFIHLFTGFLILNGIILIEVILFIVLAVFFIALMSCLGLMCSVISKNSNVSLLYALTLWLVFAIVIPNTSILWADKLFPIEGYYSVGQKIEKRRQEIIASYPSGKWTINERQPFIPEHKIRSSMMMDFVINEKKFRDEYYLTMFHQYENSRIITCSSPLSLFQFSMEAVTSGGYLRFQRNWEMLHLYQQQFFQWFKSIDALDKDSPHWLNPWENYSSSKKPVKFEEVPIYNETPTDMSVRFQKFAIYTGILIIYIFLAFSITFLKFLKSDIR